MGEDITNFNISPLTDVLPVRYPLPAPPPSAPAAAPALPLQVWAALLTRVSGQLPAVPVPQFLSQSLCHSVEALSALLLHALREDETGMASKFVFCAVDSILQLQLAIEQFEDSQLDTFQCTLPSSLRSRANVFTPAGTGGGGGEGVGRQQLAGRKGGRGEGSEVHVHYKLHTSSDALSPQLQSVLTSSRNAASRLVHAYSDVLAANNLFNPRNFSSVAVAEALKDLLASESLQ